VADRSAATDEVPANETDSGFASAQGFEADHTLPSPGDIAAENRKTARSQDRLRVIPRSFDGFYSFLVFSSVKPGRMSADESLPCRVQNRLFRRAWHVKNSMLGNGKTPASADGQIQEPIE